MTKARLQAEAAKQQTSPAAMERREQPPPTAVSPHPLQAPVAFAPSRSRTHSRDGWSQCSRGDADDFSVCSVTSDFPGSESVFTTGPSPSPSPFVPNRPHLGSYGSVSVNGPTDNFAVPEMVALQPGSSAAYVPAAVADYYNPNRRRAQTLSPRQGLSHLDEDRQVLSGPEFPGMSSFSTPPSNRHYPRASNSNSNNSSSATLFTGMPTRPMAVDSGNRAHTFSMGPTMSVSDRTLGSSDWMENRTRTSSAASMPAMSQTAEEFFLIDSQPFPRSSFHQLAAEIGVLAEEDDSGPSVTGLADVFRAPPGFASSATPSGGDALGSSDVTHGLNSTPLYAGGDVRNRASTWAPDSMFGSSSSLTTPSLGIEELAAILKLSEAEDSSSLR